MTVTANRRPVSVTIIGCIFLAAGSLGLAYHISDWRWSQASHSEILLVSITHVLAILCGVYLLRGSNWARWLAVAWIAFHVALSFFHPLPELLMHILLLAVFAYFLFRPPSTRYFKLRRTEASL